MSRRWHIKADGVHGGSNKTMLIDCSIARDTHTDQYLFMGPEANGLPLAAVSIPVQFPFWFPTFKSELSGTAPLDWYIRVDYVDGGPDLNQAHGRWRNTPPKPGDDDESGPAPPTDTDTWTSQAGVGGHMDDDQKKYKDKSAVASASSK
jgi:hypothetical protein